MNVKVHRVTFFVVDFDELGADGVQTTLENQRFPNHCISPTVLRVETADCGEWSDDHPLNNTQTMKSAADKLFAAHGEQA